MWDFLNASIDACKARIRTIGNWSLRASHCSASPCPTSRPRYFLCIGINVRLDLSCAGVVFLIPLKGRVWQRKSDASHLSAPERGVHRWHFNRVAAGSGGARLSRWRRGVRTLMAAEIGPLAHDPHDKRGNWVWPCKPIQRVGFGPRMPRRTGALDNGAAIRNLTPRRRFNGR